MNISDAGLDLIRSFEGYHDKLPDGSCRAYLDKLAKPHVWTIGFGCTRDVKAGMVWTREKAEAALREEVAEHEGHVRKYVTVDINQHQFDALVSFCYNVGPGGVVKGTTIPGLSTSTLLKKLNKGDYKGAAGEFKRWNKAGGKVWPGLVDRRAREATLFLTPVDVPDEPAMPQAVEEGPQKIGAKTAAAVSLAGGSVMAEIIRAPSTEITDTVSNLSGWQSLVTAARSLTLFGVEFWPWVLAFGATVGVLTWWSRRTS